MLIMSQDKETIVNTDVVQCIYVSGRHVMAGINTGTANTATLAGYDTAEEAKAALKEIFNAIKVNADFVTMFTQEEIEKTMGQVYP